MYDLYALCYCCTPPLLICQFKRHNKSNYSYFRMNLCSILHTTKCSKKLKKSPISNVYLGGCTITYLARNVFGAIFITPLTDPPLVLQHSDKNLRKKTFSQISTNNGTFLEILRVLWRWRPTPVACPWHLHLNKSAGICPKFKMVFWSRGIGWWWNDFIFILSAYSG